MRFLMLMLNMVVLAGCTTTPPHNSNSAPLAKTTLPPLAFAAQRYPNQTPQCSGHIHTKRGHIQWVTATTSDPMPQALHYYNRKTGILKRRTKRNEHLWAVINRNTPLPERRSLSLLSIDNAKHLKLLCSKPAPLDAETVIVVSKFTAPARPLRDYTHAAP